MTHAFSKTTQTLSDGSSARLVYDREGDILDVFFGKNEPARGIQLTDQIVLRVDALMERVISLTILDYSLVTRETTYGRRSFPLTHLDALPEGVRVKVSRLLTSAPVDQFLKLSHFHTSPTKYIPITYVAPQSAMATFA